MDPHRYPAARVALLFVLGIAIGSVAGLHAAAIPLFCVFFLAASLLLLLAVRQSASSHGLSESFALVLCVAMGAGRIAVDESENPEGVPDHSDSPGVLRGTIIEASESEEGRVRCVVAGEALRTDSVWRPIFSNFLMRVKKPRVDSVQAGLRYGMEVVCCGVVSVPPEQRNPGEFNMRKYYEAIGISHHMQVRSLEDISVLDSTAGSWYMREIVEPMRIAILHLISSTLKGQEGELLKGILIGERGGMSLSNKTAFANAGVAHVLAVSGSNVAFVAAVLFGILELLRVSKLLRVLATSAGLILFMFITGNQAPVVRATIMALVFLLGSVVQEKPNPYNSVGLAILIILMGDAHQLYDVGFQLSFAAALSIIHFYPILNRLIGRLPSRTRAGKGMCWTLRVCAVSASAMAGTVPITAVYFGKVSIIGLLANIIVVPLVGASVVVGCVSIAGGAVSHWLAGIFAAANFVLLRGTLIFTELAGGNPYATIDAYRFRPLYALPYYCALLLLFHVATRNIASKLAIALLAGLNIAFTFSAAGTSDEFPARLRVSFIDVGQGDAALIEFLNSRTMLIDAGPQSGEYDAGERVVAPFLKRRGVDLLHLLIISHPDADHIGGATRVLQSIPVKLVVDNGLVSRSGIFTSYSAQIKESRVDIIHASAGMTLDIDPELRIYVLSPGGEFFDVDTTSTEPSLNSASVVVKLQYGSASFLFVGDADRAAEGALVNTYGDFLKSTVLKVGHHGSGTSSTQSFLESVRPDVAVISVGKNNRFNHPSTEVLQRLDDLSADVVRTDEEGAVIFASDGETVWRLGWR